ncbi:MAG: hypothetical protein Q8760_02245 [Candidatus Phytoplasma australasiaticum]|nr:hypothetical protein [Candidatus Phytoplasma australasiaticum]
MLNKNKNDFVIFCNFKNLNQKSNLLVAGMIMLVYLFCSFCLDYKYNL